MVSIPKKLRKEISQQQSIIIGSADHMGVANISPRSTFLVSGDGIYWLEFFKHKTYHNFRENRWVSVAFYDQNKLTGHQLKGKVNILTDKRKKHHIATKIIQQITKQNKKHILKLVTEHPYKIIEFKPKLIYTLKPREFADIPGMIDADIEVDRFLGEIIPKFSLRIQK